MYANSVLLGRFLVILQILVLVVSCWCFAEALTLLSIDHLVLNNFLCVTGNAVH